jgi:hypothetical protein
MSCIIPLKSPPTTRTPQNIENEINFNTDFNVYGSIGTSASRGRGGGAAIFINKAVNYKVIDKLTDENGRIVLLNA